MAMTLGGNRHTQLVEHVFLSRFACSYRKTQRLFVMYHEIRIPTGIYVQGFNLPWTCRVPPGTVAAKAAKESLGCVEAKHLKHRTLSLHVSLSPLLVYVWAVDVVPPSSRGGADLGITVFEGMVNYGYLDDKLGEELYG